MAKLKKNKKAHNDAIFDINKLINLEYYSSVMEKIKSLAPVQRVHPEQKCRRQRGREAGHKKRAGERGGRRKEKMEMKTGPQATKQDTHMRKRIKMGT